MHTATTRIKCPNTSPSAIETTSTSNSNACTSQSLFLPSGSSEHLANKPAARTHNSLLALTSCVPRSKRSSGIAPSLTSIDLTIWNTFAGVLSCCTAPFIRAARALDWVIVFILPSAPPRTVSTPRMMSSLAKCFLKTRINHQICQQSCQGLFSLHRQRKIVRIARCIK